jgi:UMF1 family MFS transporter
MSRFIPKGRENEFFGFFAFSGKATAFIGPFLLGLLTQIFDMRAGIMIVAILLIAGYLVLKSVDEEAGTQVGNT